MSKTAIETSLCVFLAAVPPCHETHIFCRHYQAASEGYRSFFVGRTGGGGGRGRAGARLLVRCLSWSFDYWARTPHETEHGSSEKSKPCPARPRKHRKSCFETFKKPFQNVSGNKKDRWKLFFPCLQGAKRVLLRRS